MSVQESPPETIQNMTMDELTRLIEMIVMRHMILKQPTISRKREDYQETFDYIAQHRITVPEGFPSIEDLIREDRDSR